MAIAAPLDPVVPGAPMDPTPLSEAVKTPSLRRFDDIEKQREEIYNYARDTLAARPPIENSTHRLELTDVDYEGPFTPSKADEKKAILRAGSLHRPLRGTFRVVNKETGEVVDEQRATVARVPHLNSRGLFIRNGVVWAVRNQARLRPGVYTRRRADGATESQVNVKPGSGRGFRLLLEPESGLMKLQVGQSTTRLYPILRELGVEDEQLKEAWGEELFEKNFRPRSGNDFKDLRKVVSKLGSGKVEVAEDLLPTALRESLERIELDEDTTELTLGEKIKHLSPEAMVGITRKILRVAQQQEDPDNRDSQAFQSVHAVEDFIKERLERNQSRSLYKLLWKASREGKLGSVPSGVMDKDIGSIFEGSGLAMSVEDINPFEIHDMRQAVTRMGQGGISSEQAVSRDARGVQASYLGVIDAGRGPESSKLGLDLRLTDAAEKGADNQLYTTVRNPKTGDMEKVSARTLSSKVVAFPGELSGKRQYVRARMSDGSYDYMTAGEAENNPDVMLVEPTKRIPAVKDDKIQFVDRSEVDYEIPQANNLMSRATAMIPFPQAIKGQRLLMGARMTAQAMPLKEPEAPLVQTADADGESLHKKMGATVGAAYSPVEGVVTSVTADEVKVRTPDGETKVISLYNNYPTARKTRIHNTPVVEKGQTLTPGQLVARSNFTDSEGVASPGRNLRVAFMAAEGDTIEDAFVISESAAKKLTSEALYKSDIDLSHVESTDKNKYISIYADRFSPEQYKKVGEDGVVAEGQEVQTGDPLILAFGKKGPEAVGAVMDTPRSSLTDLSQTWDHNAPGVVTDVVRSPKGIKVTVQSYDTMQKADKLSGRFGNKGVISAIRPDEQMPTDAEGRPVEVIANAYGIISRTNPGALAEALLGKVAQKTGKPYVIKGFEDENVAKFALEEALKHGVVSVDESGKIIDTETLTDPRDGRKIPGVFTGTAYMMKLQHMAEGKLSARDMSTYTTEGMPAKGGKEGSKRVAVLDSHALLSSGATEFLRDAKLIRGQRNDDYWRALRNGETPVAPAATFANEQFRNLLKAAGVNLREKGSRTQLAPMLDSDVDKLAKHEIEHGKTFNFETMKPVPGGLFDMAATGGASGNRFAKITLPVKIPHPMFTDAVQKLLGVTGKKLEQVMAGEEKLGGETGPAAIERALSSINIEREEARAKELIRVGSKAQRDQAVRRLNYITGLKKMGIAPKDLLISKIPVIPPKYRPVVSGQNIDIVNDLNYLYHDLLEARQNYVEAEQELGSAGEEAVTIWNAVRAVVGSRDPVNPKTAEQGVKGILRYAIGVGDTPKAAFFQRKVMGSAVDTVGRGVITADPKLDMDEVSIPKDMAWKVFRPYVIRRLVRQGLPAAEAIKEVKSETPRAMKELESEMAERPVVYNRAPALHRYAYVGAKAKLRDDDAIGLPYYTLKGIGGDYDGDQINVHVPSSDEAVEEVKQKLLPSKNLWFTGDFETHLEPVQDYLAGLYLATKPDEKQPVKVFSSRQAAIDAYKRGDISARTPVRIVE